MCTRVWGTNEDGSLEFVSLTRDTLDQAIEIMLKSFFIHENVCIGAKLSQNPGATIELKELCLKYAKHGLSIVAIEKETGKVAAVTIHALRVQSNVQSTYYEQCVEKSKNPSVKCVFNFLVTADNTVDLYELCDTNCLLEITFMSVLPQYRGRGIARKSFELSLKIGKALSSGENIKVPVDDEPLLVAPPPGIIAVLCTAKITQHLSKSFGFTIASKIDYKDFTFDGETFASRIGPEPAFATIEYLKLE